MFKADENFSHDEPVWDHASPRRSIGALPHLLEPNKSSAGVATTKQGLGAIETGYEESCSLCSDTLPGNGTPPANAKFAGVLERALDAAAARALAHEKRSLNKLQVRFCVTHHCCRHGLTIIVGTASPYWTLTNEAQEKVIRRVTWQELEARAAELPSLVDEVIAELEARLDL
jgi:hypothetical protein